LTGESDIDAANELRPEYVGFVFAPKSRRYVTPERAAELKRQLAAGIKAVGVFVNDDLYHVAELLNRGIIDIAQLHGSEDEEYIGHLRQLTGKPIIRAYRIKTAEDIAEAEKCTADHVLLDSGAGTGEVFDWKLIKNMKRPYFLAGGLSPDNVENAVEQLSPYAVDVSSGIETDGVKDKAKMAAFAAAVRGEKI
jgi:phosphoribosylanthranilate isomerase